MYDLDKFKHPNRKPWLLLIMLVVTGLIFWDRYRDKNQPEEDFSPPEDVSEETVFADDIPPENKGSEEKPEKPLNKADLKKILSQARQLDARNLIVKARRKYLDVLRLPCDSKTRTEIEKRLGAINIQLAMSPMNMAEKTEYVVKSGDNLQKIARQYGTTVELLQKSNNIKNPRLIKIGDRYRILNGTFTIVVSKTRNDLILYFNGEFFKRYPAGTGKYGKTPVGRFVIKDKIKDPPWWRPDGTVVDFSGDPEGENILGTRWMSIEAVGDTPDAKGFGIHGTWDEPSVGKAESAGCIRLKNRDVEEIYALVPLGISVSILE
jgi:lipoprotein-anchoring transpeptidase ErfK/SrfK